jgi:hypothetical protein
LLLQEDSSEVVDGCDAVAAATPKRLHAAVITTQALMVEVVAVIVPLLLVQRRNIDDI